MKSIEREDAVSRMRHYVRDHICEMAGTDDPSGTEIVSLIHLLNHEYSMIGPAPDHEGALSGPRFGLLMRLYAEEMRGNPQGLTPTQISRFQNVSKNTISALLRGLEEQGLLERELDPGDLRLFRIRLTTGGRGLVSKLIPERVALHNRLVSGLSAEERQELIALLAKLHGSIVDHVGAAMPAACAEKLQKNGGTIGKS
jgi:DNA-binding MarR family transcriptional regulator